MRRRGIELVSKEVADKVAKVSMSEVDLPRNPVGYFPSGSTLLNLALSETPNSGWAKGTIANVVGDKHTGKSILQMTALAEMAHTDRFPQYRLIYDDAEAAVMFDMRKLFGDLADRIEPPLDPDKHDFPYSDTVESLQANVYQALDAGRPFVYVLDSLDGLTAKDEVTRVHKAAELHLKGKSPDKGSYGTERARKVGELIRVFARDLQKTESLMIIVSQVRQNLDPVSWTKYRRNGGKALDHHCSHIVWLAPGKRITKQVSKRERQIGVRTSFKVDKNRSTGKLRSGEFLIYAEYGVDDIGSMVDWMADEGFWRKDRAGKIDTGAFLNLGEVTRDRIIQIIEEERLANDLQEHVLEAWMQIEKSMSLGRRPRFGPKE